MVSEGAMPSNAVAGRGVACGLNQRMELFVPGAGADMDTGLPLTESTWTYSIVGRE